MNEPKKPKKHKLYMNYVLFVLKLQDMTDEELQSEMEFRRTALRMCEQELRRRRTNARTIQRAVGNYSVANK